MQEINDHSEIKEGMQLKSISESHEGTVEMIDSVLQSDCMGWGFEPISELDIDDVFIIDGTIACECCGERKYTSQSNQNIAPYPEKVLVTYCGNCDLHLYKAPELIE